MIHTEIVDEREEACSEEEGKKHGEESIAILEQTRRQGSFIPLPQLDADEDGNHESEADKQADDARVAPRVVGASPLQCKKQTDDGRDEDDEAQDVELAHAGDEAHVHSGGVVAVDLDKEEDDDHGDGTNGQVDVEAPAPSAPISETAIVCVRASKHMYVWPVNLRSAEKRTSYTGDSPHATDETESHRAFAQRHNERENDNRAGEEASRSNLVTTQGY